MDQLINLIIMGDFLQSENADVLTRVQLVTQNLIDAAGKNCKKH